MALTANREESPFDGTVQVLAYWVFGTVKMPNRTCQPAMTTLYSVVPIPSVGLLNDAQ